MSLRVKKESGVALIIVLMMTAVMGVVMLYMSAAGQNSSRLAGIIKQNTDAVLNVESVQAELVFSFITTEFAIVGPQEDFQGKKVESPFTDNLTGKINEHSDYKVSVQDLSGLVSLVPFNKKGFIRLLISQGGDEKNIPLIVDRLDDWQDNDSLVRLQGAEKGDYAQPYLPTNSNIQSSKELIYILEDKALFERIRSYLTFYSSDYIDRQFMSNSLYSALGITGQNKEVKSAEGMNYPSGRFLIEITTKKNTSLTKRFILLRGSDSFRPFFITDDELIFR